MSTKTTFKRIALVAVAVLGAGVLSVAPANATLATTAAVVTNTSGVVYGAVGTAATATIALATTTAETTGVTATDTIVITPTIASQPVGGGLTVGAPASGKVGLSSPVVTGNFAATGTEDKWTNTVLAGVQSLKPHTTVGTIPAFTAAAISTLLLTAAVAGTYTVTLTPAGATTTNTPVTVTFHVAGLAFSLGDGAAVSPAIVGNGIAGTANTVTVNATTNASNTRALVIVSGAGATIISNAGAALVAGATSTIVAAGTNAPIIIGTPTAGTVTVSEFYESGSGTGIYAAVASKTVTITVNAASVTGVVVAANSTSLIGATTVEATTVDATAVTASAVASTAVVANITVLLKDSVPNTIATGFLTASISGPGTIGIVAARADLLGATGTNNVYGKNVIGATTANRIVNVYSDGTAGIATITFSSGTTVIATETVTFVGAAASYTVVQTRGVYASATPPTTPGTQSVTVTVKDAAGNAVIDGTTVNAASVTTTTVATIGATAVTTAGVATFTIAGVAAGTSVITFGNLAASATVSATTTVTVGSASVASVVMTLDKTSYLPGEKMTLTITANSVDGKPVADGVYTLFSTYPTSSRALSAGTLPTTTITLTSGVFTYTLNAPVTEGTFTISGVDSLTALNVVSVSAASENGASSAAAQAAAQDAADAVAALSAQVAELVAALRKQITSLTNLVIKIQKKVKA
jgi:hypothetical protein